MRTDQFGQLIRPSVDRALLGVKGVDFIHYEYDHSERDCFSWACSPVFCFFTRQQIMADLPGENHCIFNYFFAEISAVSDSSKRWAYRLADSTLG